MSSRDKIIAAGVEMLRSDPKCSLSVRAVAAQAGVSTGTLRHFFPTQHLLMDAVFTGLYSRVFPDGNVHDSTIPARERLMGCVQHMLGSVGTVEQTLATWNDVFARFLSPDASAAARAEFDARTQHTLRRIEYWLGVLTSEGALPAGDNPRRARFLMTIVSGILIERISPWDRPVFRTEAETLAMAIDAVFTLPA